MTPLISFVIPTLNAGSILPDCLKSISIQKYPKNRIELIIADGGSTDKTLIIAKQYNARIFFNPLKTAESGKALGVKKAQGDFIALIDSDNLLPNPNWLSTMIRPLIRNSKIVASEPIKFTYRLSGGFIERYSALIGANDPYAFFNGIYDRYSYLSRKWTNLKIDQIDKGNYLLLSLNPGSTLPTLGANGTIFRSNFLKKNLISDYLFDIDILTNHIQKNQKPVLFAKVKIGIIHTYCESSISKFAKKQQRRLTDYFYYRQIRQFNWANTNRFGIIKFTTYTISLVFPIVDSLKGFITKPDLAWFFHPLACLISLFIYTKIFLLNYLGLLKPLNRKSWHQ